MSLTLDSLPSKSTLTLKKECFEKHYWLQHGCNRFWCLETQFWNTTSVLKSLVWLFEPQLIKFEKKTINRVLINCNGCFETPIQSPSWTFNPRLTRSGNLGQHCTLQQAFKQFGAVHMHNHDDTYPPLPWFEPGTSMLPVVTSPSRSGQPQSLRMSHRGRPSTMYLAQRT